MNLQQFTQPFWVSFGNYLTASTKEEQATEHLFIYHLTVLCFATFSESFGTTPLGTFPRFRFWINVANRFASARRQKVNCWETHLHLFAVHLWAFPYFTRTSASMTSPATNCPLPVANCFCF